MGAPRRNRRKYQKPKDIWNLQRIHEDNTLKDEYGLKNMKELWKVQSKISGIRGTVRELLSGRAVNPLVETNILSNLSRYGIISSTSTLDNVLDLNANAFLERRLQSVVFRKGLARSMRQARQLIVHGFISINGRKVDKPGYTVSPSEENYIGYYKPIDIAPKVTAGASEHTAAEAQPEQHEASEQTTGSADQAPDANQDSANA
ncbi:MAG: 30S ribosomal protein S4 [Candidatus Marsarchaeota archaeon]|nr:30S ribosomal protein S4 [Candidatus Marsarchaeota archaeon]